MTSRLAPQPPPQAGLALLTRSTRAMAPVWALVASAGIHAAVLTNLGGVFSGSEADPDGLAASLWMGAEGTTRAGGDTVAIEVASEEPSTSDRETGEAGAVPSKSAPGPADAPISRTTPKARPSPNNGARPPNRRSSLSTHVASAGASGGGTGPGGEGSSPGDVGAPGPVIRGVTLPLLRVLPLALSADPSWSNVAVGTGVTIELALAVDDAGRVRLDRPAGASGVAQVPALLDQMLRLLAWPRFAVRPAEMGPGIDKVRLSISVTQDAASAEALAASGGAYGLGADAPAGRKPGRAHCTWANGRRVNVMVHRIDP